MVCGSLRRALDFSDAAILLLPNGSEVAIHPVVELIPKSPGTSLSAHPSSHLGLLFNLGSNEPTSTCDEFAD